MERICRKTQIKAYSVTLWLLAAVFILASFFCMPVQAAQEKEIREIWGEGRVNADTLNIRSGPGTEYDVVDSVSRDQLLQVTGQSDNGWYRVLIDGKEGYVSDQYVTFTEKEQTLAEDNEETYREGNREGDNRERENEEETEGQEGGYISQRYLDYIKIAGISLIILVLVILMIFTVRGIGSSGQDREDDDIYEDQEDEGDAHKETGRTYSHGRNEVHGKRRMDEASAQKQFVTEEDYQLHIDPIYFKDEKD